MADSNRVAIFIDGSNFYHSVKETFDDLHDNEVDFAKLAELLKGNGFLVDVFYYSAPLDRGYNPEIYRKQQRFFDELRKIPGFHVVLCRMRKIRQLDGTVEFSVKGDDIHLATDLISLAYENKYDKAVLVSGDGDFVPAIQKVQKLGKRIENAYFSTSQSNFLKQVCNSSTLLDKLLLNCLKGKK